MLPIHTEFLRIKSYEVDFQNRWKAQFLQQTLQEAAAVHAAELGYSYEGMFRHGLAWILSRLRIDFYFMPPMGAEVRLRTWPRGVQQRLFFTRDFHLETMDGQAVARATSAWVLIDLAKHRILPPTALPGELPSHSEEAIPDLLEKILVPEMLPFLGEYKAGYSTIDPNGHANSALYVAWLLDSFPFEHYRSRRLSCLQLNFSSEVKPGETVRFHAAETPAGWVGQGTIVESGVRAFDAAFAWAAVEEITNESSDDTEKKMHL